MRIVEAVGFLYFSSVPTIARPPTRPPHDISSRRTLWLMIEMIEAIESTRRISPL